MSDNSEILVRAENVSKKFCRSLKKSLLYGVQDIAGELTLLFKRRDYAAEPAQLRPGEFFAVQNVSFALKRGECLGLIGRNGAGKTTLLKMLNGLIKPDAGRVEIRGRVGALIELGAGFHPLLTGRENIFVNGAVLGFSKAEIKRKFDAIVDFAGIGDFLDTPVQNYSSGMKVRLGFAIAAQMEPDVLLIDEVLAVGDLGFRAKCYEAISNLLSRCAVIFVSHQMHTVFRICRRVLVMDKGAAIFDGEAAEGINVYNRLASETRSTAEILGTGEAEINNFRLLNERGEETESFAYGQPLQVEFDLRVAAQYQKFLISLTFKTRDGLLLAQAHSNCSGIELENTGSAMHFSVRLPAILLNPGAYDISLVIFDEAHVRPLNWSYRLKTITVTGDFIGAGFFQLPAQWSWYSQALANEYGTCAHKAVQ